MHNVFLLSVVHDPPRRVLELRNYLCFTTTIQENCFRSKRKMQSKEEAESGGADQNGPGGEQGEGGGGDIGPVDRSVEMPRQEPQPQRLTLRRVGEGHQGQDDRAKNANGLLASQPEVQESLNAGVLQQDNEPPDETMRVLVYPPPAENEDGENPAMDEGWLERSCTDLSKFRIT